MTNLGYAGNMIHILWNSTCKLHQAAYSEAKWDLSSGHVSTLIRISRNELRDRKRDIFFRLTDHPRQTINYHPALNVNAK